MNSIFLLGYMGCGKSTIGKALAERLKLPFVDLDAFIEQQEDMPITSIFSQKGELYFRQCEKRALHSLMASKKATMVALGGGTPCYFDNMLRLSASAHSTIYLKASISSLSARLMNEKQQRPIISHISSLDSLNEFVGKHLFERSPFYLMADIVIDLDRKSVPEIVDTIQSLLT